MINLAPYRKSIAAAIAGAATYLIGVLPAEGGFGDLSTVQWLGLVVALLGPGGLVWAIPNSPSTTATPDSPVSVAVKDSAGQQVGTVVVPGGGTDVQQPTSTPEPDLSRLDRLDGLDRREP